METLAQIALTMTPGLGSTSIRRLIDVCPDADELFSMSHRQLKELFGNHDEIVSFIEKKAAHTRAEEELRFMEQHGIQALFFTDPDYPQRMNRTETADCPALLYVLGKSDLNAERAVAVVGTRKATAHGRDVTDRLIGQMAEWKASIVSGLAYGIDTAAHMAALSHGLPTIAALGHGLDRIYPAQNRKLAERILAEGGALVTEYPSGTAINGGNFPARNRIIAGMSDATLVVEASSKGGALITAAIATSYQREVFAVPGRITDTYSSGTNNLIATNKAAMLRSADDMAYQMGWPATDATKTRQQELFPTLGATEQNLVDLLHKQQTATLDDLVRLSGLPLPKVAGIMFTLEMQKVVRALPGRLYEVCD